MSSAEPGSTSRLWPAVAILVAASGLAIAIAFTPGANNPTVEVGFNDNAVSEGLASPVQVARLIAAAGGGVDRVQIAWSSLEPARGEFDFRPYDAIYRADLARRVRPLFIFAFAPGWAT